MKQKRTLWKSLLILTLFVACMCGNVNVSAAETMAFEDKCGLRRPEIIEDNTIAPTVYKRVYANSTEQNYWTKFAGDYYYNQLSDVEKRMWDSLETECIALAVGEEDASRVAVQVEGGISAMDTQELLNFLCIFKYANPQYYFLNSQFGYSTFGNELIGAIYLYDEFEDGAVRKNYTNDFCGKLDTWVAQVASAGRDESKVKCAHDIIAANTDYGYGNFDQSAYSMVCEGQTVCAGYTAALQLLLEPNGVPTTIVTSLDHAWNNVWLHGQWYAVDATWDDQDIIRYNFYTKSNATMQQGNSSHTPEELWDGYLPELKYDSTLSDWYTYYSPYFTAGNYVYFKVNDNAALAERYAAAVDTKNGAVLANAPAQVTYEGNTYTVLQVPETGPETPTPGDSNGGSNGQTQPLNGLCQSADGNWYYYIDGEVATNYTGLAYDANVGWWYVENGIINFNYNGLIPYGDAWWCVAGGAVCFDYTGLWCDPNVGWWYVENGTINFNYNGLIPFGDAWWCVAGGQVCFDYTGLWCDPYVGWWYVENGTINFNYNGLIPFGDAWWCVAGGQVCFDYTGLWCDPYVGWWYVENGTINFNYNGFIPFGDAWWCVAGGQVCFDYTGLWYDPYVGWWYVENGAINFGYTGVVWYNGGNFQVANGMVVF